MLLDNELFLANNQVLGTSTTTITGSDNFSTNFYDLGTLGGNLGAGEPLMLTVMVGTTAFAATGGLTNLNIRLVQGNAASGNAAARTLVTLAETGLLLPAALTANALLLQIPIPKLQGATTAAIASGGNTTGDNSDDNAPASQPNTFLRRYVGLQYVITGDSNGGTITSFINKDTYDRGDAANNYSVRTN